MSDLVSVIVPAYKVEKYIEKCVESILRQTYKNLEIILVDDGSPDRCGEICDTFSTKDKRVKVIHKKNGGLSDARNAALDIQTGKYITFIDSDDFVSEDYIQYLYSIITAYDADIAIGDYKYIKEDGTILNHPIEHGRLVEMDKEKALFELLNSRLFTNSAWGKLYKKECFEGIRYPYGKLYEDVPTTYRTFLRSNKIVFGAKANYYYLFRTSAISKQRYSTARMDAVVFAEKMVEDITKKYPLLHQIGECRMFDSYLSVFSLLNEDEWPVEYSEIWNKIRRIRKNVLFYGLSGKKRKILALCSYLGAYFLKKVI